MSINEIWINDRQYRYSFYESNHSNAPYGIFLMGTLQEIESVTFLSEKFSEELNLFVVEVPGTGLTDPLPATFSIQDQTEMLRSFIAYMNIPSAHIMAISYATPMAVELCASWDGALSLSMCGGMAGVVGSLRLGTMALLADALRDRKAFAENFIKGMTVDDKSIPRGKVIARSARQKILRHSEKQIACFCENTVRLLAYKPSSSISTIQQPCLLFIGEKDPYVTIEKAKELASQLPNCHFETVRYADHLVHLEHPERTAELMIQLAKDESGDKMLGKVPESVVQAVA